MSEAGQRLREDLAFAAPEMWPLHIERRIAEAIAADRAELAAQTYAKALLLGWSNETLRAFLDLIER